jgi:hypothetical protein
MPAQSSPNFDFWRWFLDHQVEFNGLSKPDEPFWDLALEKLQEVDKRLWIELSDFATKPREFIVTAEGHTDAFPIAEALIHLAPIVDGWEFLALKPAMGFDFTTSYEGKLFDPRGMWFLPLQSPSRPNWLGIRIGIEDLESADERDARHAVLIILDTALGERSAALDIQHTEVSKLPARPESEGYIELPDLARYILWRNRV